MNQEPEFLLLKGKGDPFEIIISEEVEALSLVLSPYARLWANHVYPRRVGDGSTIEENWMPFGSRHYTALVRLYHAYCAKQKLLDECASLAQSRDRELNFEDYKVLLHLQASCSAFWENLGSAIDNFTHAWDDARRLLVGNAKSPGTTDGDKIISSRTISQSEYPELCYAYNRRTQFIHSAIVPKRIEGGLVEFNLRHYDDERTNWRTNLIRIEAIDHKIQEDWGRILNELGGAWESMFSWLQSHDKDRRRDKQVSPPVQIRTDQLELSGNFSPEEMGEFAKFGSTFTVSTSGSDQLCFEIIK